MSVSVSRGIASLVARRNLAVTLKPKVARWIRVRGPPGPCGQLVRSNVVVEFNNVTENALSMIDQSNTAMEKRKARV